MKRKTNNRFLIFSLLLGLLFFKPSHSYADCVSPAAPAGRIDYTSAAGEQVFKFCNGTSWVPWAGEPVVGAAAPSSGGGGIGADAILESNLKAVNGATDEYCLTYESTVGDFEWQTCGGGGTPAGSNTQIQFNNSGAFGASANLTWNGSVFSVVGDINYTGVIIDVSDIRMKENIQPLQNPLARLTSLNGFSFEMKGDPRHAVEYGVAAQDVQKVFPELVREVRADGTLGVSYDGLIAPIIESIKELKAQNEALEAQNEALKARLERLEKTTTTSREEY